jgi:aspartate beta-hydroxylase
MIAQNDDERIRQLIENATQACASGRVQEADRLVRQAEAKAPRQPLGLNETVRRGLNRTVEQMAAIDQVLALEPRNFRAMLQKASLHELQGHRRAAAMTYRQALQSVPAGSPPPQSMRPVFEHALQFVEDFIEGRLQDLRARYAEDRRR